MYVTYYVFNAMNEMKLRFYNGISQALVMLSTVAVE